MANIEEFELKFFEIFLGVIFDNQIFKFNKSLFIISL